MAAIALQYKLYGKLIAAFTKLDSTVNAKRVYIATIDR